MPLTPGQTASLPGFWEGWGHSYFNTPASTLYITGRMDAVLRDTLGLSHMAWRNRAVTGSQLIIQGRSQGGYARMLQECVKSTRTSPYAANGGGAIFCWGINDIGNTGNTSQVQTAFGHALRTCISRWRASSIKADSDASISYGAGFVTNTNTQDFTSGTTFHGATSLTNANFTITLPSDYNGEVVALCFVGAAGVFGGSGTFSGTASFATGTLSTSNIMPSASLSHCPIVRRFQGTAADAGKTIIFTVNSLDSGGQVGFNCWWLEADNPPPVIVCNIARLLTAGYASYPTWSSSQAGADTDVANFNSVIASVVAEFDAMVQIADLDHALNKDQSNPSGIPTLYYTDGVHPNEYGAAKCSDAIVTAIRRLSPVTGLGPAGNLQVDSPLASAARRPRLSGNWYMPEFCAWNSAVYTSVAGHMFAFPVIITEGRERWIQFQLEQTNAPTSGSSIRWGVYDDVGWTGYPQCLVSEPTASSGALALGSTAGMKQSPASGSGSVNIPIDPGLYWIALKIDSISGTPSQLRSMQGPVAVVPNNAWAAGVQGTDCAWRVAGLSAGALPGTFPTGGVTAGTGTTGGNNSPALAFKIF